MHKQTIYKVLISMSKSCIDFISKITRISWPFAIVKPTVEFQNSFLKVWSKFINFKLKSLPFGAFVKF